ncbi:hypothetical protein HYQ45_017293 [Verticillium longisporum]|uniref:Uncharacterized protein n=1 Tax=Verticillium longisporum TaxID=100787 RepID=A0A8I2Z2P4_VERLO|nr:hypothetical protein HYQ45_017293 [Verticillium longisporum]
MAKAATTATDDNVEILVHVAAPAMSKDDATYRALANAYLAFHPASRTSLPALTSQHAQQGPTTPEQQPPSSKTHEPFGPSFESAELSFEGAWDNADSPGLAAWPQSQPYQSPYATGAPSHTSPPVDHAEMMDAEDSWIAPPSTVPDSMPWNDLRLPELSSPSRTMEHFLGLLEDCSSFDDSSLDDSVMGTSPIRQGGETVKSCAVGKVPIPGMRPPLLPLPSQREPSSELSNVDSDIVVPASSSLPPVMRRGPSGFVSRAEENRAKENRAEENRADDSIIEETILEETILEENILEEKILEEKILEEKILEEKILEEKILEEKILEDTTVEDTTVEDTPLPRLKRNRPHHSRAGSDPLPSKRARLPSPDRLARSSSDTGPASPSPQTPAYPLTLRNPSDSAFISLLEIEAPAPKTSAASLSPDDLITPNMHLLMRSFGLPRRLDSVTRHRALKPFERGYWLLDCAGWEPGLAQRAWGFLYNYITDGFAGWGSRCVREAGWQWIRFWSFGHVANHVYLLLHVATERAIKSEEISWVDGAGEVVLVTKGHA